MADARALTWQSVRRILLAAFATFAGANGLLVWRDQSIRSTEAWVDALPQPSIGSIGVAVCFCVVSVFVCLESRRAVDWALLCVQLVAIGSCSAYIVMHPESVRI